MLSFTVEKTISDSDLLNRFEDSLKKSWEQIAPEAVEQIKSRIRATLIEKLSLWTPDEEVLVKFPFLRTISGFVESYLHCVRVKLIGLSLAVIVDSEEAVKRGLPSEIGDLLEYGSSEFPQIAHMREAMNLWTNSEGLELLSKMGKMPLEL